MFSGSEASSQLFAPPSTRPSPPWIWPHSDRQWQGDALRPSGSTPASGLWPWKGNATIGQKFLLSRVIPLPRSWTWFWEQRFFTSCKLALCQLVGYSSLWSPWAQPRAGHTEGAQEMFECEIKLWNFFWESLRWVYGELQGLLTAQEIRPQPLF